MGCSFYRIVTYTQSTMPIIKYYESQGLVRQIKANRPIDEVSSHQTNEFFYAFFLFQLICC